MDGQDTTNPRNKAKMMNLCPFLLLYIICHSGDTVDLYLNHTLWEKWSTISYSCCLNLYKSLSRTDRKGPGPWEERSHTTPEAQCHLHRYFIFTTSGIPHLLKDTWCVLSSHHRSPGKWRIGCWKCIITTLFLPHSSTWRIKGSHS